MSAHFHNKVALITGGASGIGRALGQELAERGARVILADHDIDQVHRTAASIPGAEAVHLDVRDASAFAAAVERAVAEHGALDFLFNNAGIGVTGEVRDMDLEAWNRVFDVNLRGVVHGVQAAYPHMVRQGHGHILNTACIAGLVPFPLTAAYCASKHAVVGLSSALRAEAAGLGVKVSVICPGTVDTPMFEALEYRNVDKQVVMSGIASSLMPAQRCARAILRGAARNKAMIPVSWHTRAVWWLYRLAPRAFLALSGSAFRRFKGRLRPASQQASTATRASVNQAGTNALTTATTARREESES